MFFSEISHRGCSFVRKKIIKPQLSDGVALIRLLGVEERESDKFELVLFFSGFCGECHSLVFTLLRRQNRVCKCISYVSLGLFRNALTHVRPLTF